MATIWKFEIPVKDEFVLNMPKGAEPLFVATQNEAGHLWARVEPDKPVETRVFRLRGTGHEVDMECTYLGSFMLRGGALVFHLFEIVR